MEKNQKIEELVAQLNEAADAYYSGKDELMSNYEWDAAFDELKKLEEETGYILPNSMKTQKHDVISLVGKRMYPEKKNLMSFQHYHWPKQNPLRNCRNGPEIKMYGFLGSWMGSRWS